MVWLPLLLPFLAGPAAGRLAPSLHPRRAAWLLAGTAVGLAAASTTALALLIVPGATHLHAVAALGKLLTPLATGSPDSVIAVAVTAAGLLTWCALSLGRALHRRLTQLRRARRLAARADGELLVLRDDCPDAYALPGRPGRIVVTTGMLRTLSAEEREALFAHERAHLRDRHHLYVAAAELAALCHPALRTLREPLTYVLERSADEAAAAAVCDRRLTARAIGRAALASRAAATRTADRPGLALAATAGPVPRRVAALLGRPAGAALGRPGSPGLPRRLAAPLIAATLLACLALSAAATVEAADDLHAGIEAAQGEAPRSQPPTR
ncbi:M56 family metallopeptidase [Streptomyces sp. NBC_00503]|uniref:M56 family metallopeptidase n=1 Tax=Streptomyces sp. NBC_00503 TaxID=2903659 RepID=UPI002E81067C|nr:M56 family metallopeptidase [Streptomyces sp. NBC_00503]WUD86241.1 M56 family metallopeptidase [Streptomyces sp. NBC_00503]